MFTFARSLRRASGSCAVAVLLLFASLMAASLVATPPANARAPRKHHRRKHHRHVVRHHHPATPTHPNNTLDAATARAVATNAAQTECNGGMYLGVTYGSGIGCNRSWVGQCVEHDGSYPHDNGYTIVKVPFKEFDCAFYWYYQGTVPAGTYCSPLDSDWCSDGKIYWDNISVTTEYGGITWGAGDNDTISWDPMSPDWHSAGSGPYYHQWPPPDSFAAINSGLGLPPGLPNPSQ